MTMESDGEVARYHFGPLERRGVVAGWRGGQIGAVAGGLVLAVLVLRAASTLAGIALALVVLGASVALATWPLAGRTAEEWAPDAVRHVVDQTGRRRAARSDIFGSLRLLCVESADEHGSAAVVHDRDRGTYTAVVVATGPGFVLLGPQDKEHRISAWSGVLAALARQGSAVHRLQWSARSLPDDGREVRRHLRSSAVLDTTSAPYRSYGALLDAESATAHTHQVQLALTVDARRGARAVKAAGGGHRGACTVVLREMSALRRLLGEAGVDCGPVLDVEDLTVAMRHGYDRQPATRAARRRGAPGGARWPWPMAVHGAWSHARVDGTWHVTYWVAEWPRRDIGPDFLGPLLVSDVRRTMALVMEPISAVDAARRIERARTADMADAELRRRGGFLHSARRRREEEVLARREVELADGHANYRFAGYVTVTADDPAALDDACSRTEQAAGRAGLELRRCYGDQARAFSCTMPLGRGLP
ncbi:MAG TPA: SCO6880 family protein [Acidimicrobiales bacterium]|nr:SCO6880 family protein [Acidimicrobiales bacterium]